MGSKLKKKIQTPAIWKKMLPGSLDNTFLHKLCKFEQNRSSGTREILTTARGLAKIVLPEKTT